MLTNHVRLTLASIYFELMQSLNTFLQGYDEVWPGAMFCFVSVRHLSGLLGQGGLRGPLLALLAAAASRQATHRGRRRQSRRREGDY